MGLKKPTVTDNDTTETSTEATQAKAADTSHAAEDAAPAETASTEVATAAQSTAVVAPQETSGQFTERMASQGYGGLEIGFGAFPVIKLATEGAFIDSEENEHGTSFVCKLLSTRSSFVYKQKGNSDSEIYYSYDRVNLTGTTSAGNTTVDGLAKEWTEEGWELEIKEYLECVILMQGDSEFEGEMFLLSVSPNSRRKLAGVVAGIEFRGQSLQETQIECSVGKKRKHGSNTYFPWAFRAVRN